MSVVVFVAFVPGRVCVAIAPIRQEPNFAHVFFRTNDVQANESVGLLYQMRPVDKCLPHGLGHFFGSNLELTERNKERAIVHCTCTWRTTISSSGSAPCRTRCTNVSTLGCALWPPAAHFAAAVSKCARPSSRFRVASTRPSV